MFSTNVNGIDFIFSKNYTNIVMDTNSILIRHDKNKILKIVNSLRNKQNITLHTGFRDLEEIKFVFSSHYLTIKHNTIVLMIPVEFCQHLYQNFFELYETKVIQLKNCLLKILHNEICFIELHDNMPVLYKPLETQKNIYVNTELLKNILKQLIPTQTINGVTVNTVLVNDNINVLIYNNVSMFSITENYVKLLKAL